MSPRGTHALVAVSLVATGAAALMEEVLWARMLYRLLGGTAFAVATVLAGFLGGIAIGGLVAMRLRPRRPLAAYGVVELACGASALVFTIVLGAAAPLAALDSGPALLLGFTVLFTVPLGAGFPLLVRFLRTDPAAFDETEAARFPRRISVFYGLNALGGCVGALLAGFALVPFLGESVVLRIAVTLQVAAGLAIVLVDRAGARAAADGAMFEPPEVASTGAPRIAAHLLLFFSGLVAFYWEVLWTRLLTLAVGSSVYSFSVVTAGVLAGIGGGSLLFSARRFRRHGLWALPLVLAALLAAAFFAVPYLPDAYLAGVRSFGFAPILWGVLGAGAVVLVPSFVVGTLFPWVVARVPECCGSLVAVNAAGAALGAYLGGPLGAAVLGLETGYELGVAIAGALVLCGLAMSSEMRPALRLALVPIAALPLVVVRFPAGAEEVSWPIERLASGVYQWRQEDLENEERTIDGLAAERELLFLREGHEVIVTVELDREGNTVLVKGNGKAEGSVPADRSAGAPPTSASLPTQILLAAYPSLLRPDGDDRSAAVIGLGSGVTVGAAHRLGLGPLTVIEIERAFRDAVEDPATREYFAPYLAGALEDSRFVVGDARRELLKLPASSDDANESGLGVVISQPSEPWIQGAAGLFTREFFELAASRLAEDGLFVQWLQLYKIDVGGLRLVVRTFQRVFNSVYIVRPPGTGGLILIGSRRPVPIARLLRPLDAEPGPERAALLRHAGVATGYDLLALVILGPEGVESWAASGIDRALNTDDRNVLEFRGPLYLHRGEELTRHNLFELRKLASDDPVTAYLGPAGQDRTLARHLAVRNNDVGDFWEALAMLRGDDSSEARQLRELIERERDAYVASMTTTE